MKYLVRAPRQEALKRKQARGSTGSSSTYVKAMKVKFFTASTDWTPERAVCIPLGRRAGTRCAGAVYARILYHLPCYREHLLIVCISGTEISLDDRKVAMRILNNHVHWGCRNMYIFYIRG